MSYQVLARKFRPGTFDGLVGQDHVVRALTHALDHDRLHHAYLFTGTRGVGKTTIARVLAKALNCETGVSSTPCGECSICQEVNENRFVDLIEVDAASRTRVDDTRELLENAQYLPTRGRYKVYLIDEVHMLSASSFNALLKTLEEPPEHVKFLLATTEPKKVPVTVLSRCLQFQLKNIAPERTAGYLAEILEQEGVPFEPAALDVIGKAARGSMRDALSIADQAIGFGQGELKLDSVVDMLGLVGRDEVGALIDALASGEAARVLAVVGELADRAVDFETLLADVLAAFHEMAVSHALGEGDSLPFDGETVQLLYQIGLMGFRDLSIAPDPRSGLEMTLLRMLAFSPDETGRAVPRIENDSASAEDSSAVRQQTESGADGSAPVAAAPANEAPAEEAPAQEAPAQEAPAQEASAEETSADEASADQASGIEAIAGDAKETRQVGQPSRPRRATGRTPWYEMVAALNLGGVARMIAEHSNLVELSDDRVCLLLDRAHDTLLGDSQAAAIERALSEFLAKPVELNIETGEVDEETPAARRLRLTEERQQDARNLLEADAAVQSLLTEFDGRLDEVQAVEIPPADPPAVEEPQQSGARRK